MLAHVAFKRGLSMAFPHENTRLCLGHNSSESQHVEALHHVVHHKVQGPRSILTVGLGCE